jgi:hypothetical protein
MEFWYTVIEKSFEILLVLFLIKNVTIGGNCHIGKYLSNKNNYRSRYNEWFSKIPK